MASLSTLQLAKLSGLIFILYLSLFSAPVEGKNVVCFYTNWAQYRPIPGRFVVSDIDASLCTHLMYAFAELNGNNVVPGDLNDVGPSGMWSNFNDLKFTNPNLRTFLAIGGANHGTAKFVNMASTSQNRAEFISHVISVLRGNRFDGVDIDWEWPGSAEKAMFTLLIQELFTAFENEPIPADSDNSRLLLSISVPAGIANVQNGFDIPNLDSYVDIWNLMTYDYYGSWNGFTGFNSPYKGPAGNQLNVESTLNYYLDNGASAEKVHLGLAFYGRTFTLNNPSDTAPGSGTSGGGTSGPYTRSSGFLAYYEICSLLNSYTEEFDSLAAVYYAYDGNGQWINYEKPSSIEFKAEQIINYNLGGAMIWAIDLDDFAGSFCNSGPYPLLKALNNRLAAVNPVTTTTTATTSTTTTSTTTPPTTTPPTTTTSTTSSVAPATNPPNNPSQITSTLPQVNADCPSLFGIFPDSSSPEHYIVCQSGAAFRIMCPDDTIFNADSTKCESSSTTISTGQTSETTTTSTTSTTTTTTASTTSAAAPAPLCPSSFGLYPDSAGCETFVYCISGMAFRVWCPPGTIFNANILKCESLSTTSYSCQTHITPTTTPTATTTTTPTPMDHCPSPFGIFPSPDDCESYFYCLSGQATRIRCPTNTIFNQDNSKCEGTAWTTYVCPTSPQ